MRGEYPMCLCRLFCQGGSPPHAWGILRRRNRRYGRSRFTPTCVGNTPAAPLVYILSAVHPHMRGEYPMCLCRLRRHRGSPPHAWGILHVCLCSFYTSRFTPTCVGNTPCFLTNSRISSVHPHMRGEYAQLPCHGKPDSGSPPHAWGIQAFCSILCSGGRFTPTCVGNTLVSGL